MSSQAPEKGLPSMSASSLNTALRYQAASAPCPRRMAYMSSVAQVWTHAATCRRRSLAHTR